MKVDILIPDSREETGLKMKRLENDLSIQNKMIK